MYFHFNSYYSKHTAVIATETIVAPESSSTTDLHTQDPAQNAIYAEIPDRIDDDDQYEDMTGDRAPVYTYSTIDHVMSRNMSHSSNTFGYVNSHVMEEYAQVKKPKSKVVYSECEIVNVDSRV